jgi:hypothetical protein
VWRISQTQLWKGSLKVPGNYKGARFGEAKGFTTTIQVFQMYSKYKCILLTSELPSLPERITSYLLIPIYSFEDHLLCRDPPIARLPGL